RRSAAGGGCRGRAGARARGPRRRRQADEEALRSMRMILLVAAAAWGALPAAPAGRTVFADPRGLFHCEVPERWLPAQTLESGGGHRVRLMPEALTYIDIEFHPL